MTKGDKFAVGITLLVMVAIAAWQALAANKEASRNPMLPSMSSVSALPSGAKATYMVLEEIGRRPVRFGRSFAQLRGRVGSLVTFGTAYDNFLPTPIDPLETASLVEWVEQGNTVLAFGDAAVSVFQVSLEKSDDSRVGDGDGVLKGLRFAGCYDRFDDIEKTDKPIIKTKAGTFGVERAIGKGKAYIFASDHVLSNEFLGSEDNAAILALTKPDATVFLDDYHRGHVAGGSPLELLPGPFRSALLLSLLVGAVMVLRATFHFGPLREGEARTLRSGAEIAWSLSRLLRQAGASSTAAREMVRAFKTEVGMPQDAPLEASLDRLAGDQDELRTRAREFGAAVEAGKMGPKQLADLTRILSEIRGSLKQQAKGIYKN